MTKQSIDRLAAIAARHERALSVAGAIWFWAGLAVYARFVDLPEFIPEGWRPWFFWAGVAFNAAWWGLLHPRLIERKKALAEAAAPEPDRHDSGQAI